MATITYNIPLGFNGITRTYDLATIYGKNNSFRVIGNQEDNRITANIYGDSRVDSLRGEGGNDTFSASAYLSSYAAVVISGGTGTDKFLSIDSIAPESLEFSISDSHIEFSIIGEDGSILNASIFYDTEYLVFTDANNKNYFYLTEDLANNRFRSVSWQEVYSRTHGSNADWYLKGLNTFSWYHVSSSTSKTLSLGQGNLTLEGINAINGTGNSLNNIITGNNAANVLNGAGGADTMQGGLGNDTYIIDNSGDRVNEAASAGNDIVRSSVSHSLDANIERLTLIGSRLINGFGNNLNNLIVGNSAANILDGGSGNDSLIGGLGKDIIRGSTGIDKFIYRYISDSRGGSASRDTITDFQGSAGERIDLSLIDAFSGQPGNQAFNYIGSNGFSGSRGEVRFSNGILQVNTGTDRIADMEIALNGVTSLRQIFLIL